MSGAVGVHRLGDKHVNFWAVADGTHVTLVDAGVPKHWRRLVTVLGAVGYQISQISAIVLTHGHFDHLGLAARIQRASGARVWIHEADAVLASRPNAFRTHTPSERPVLPYLLRHPSGIRSPAHFALNGALRTPGISDLHTIAADGDLDVPGGLRAIHTPGHTPGSTTYLLPGAAGAFTGDALVTHDAIGHHRGPCAICRGITNNSAQALDSLRALSHLDAAVVLPGHGEPTTASLAETASAAVDHGVR